MKDTRKSFKNQRVEYDGESWTFDGKASPDGQELRVYRVHGNVTNTERLKAAFEHFGSQCGFVRCRMNAPDYSVKMEMDYPSR